MAMLPTMLEHDRKQAGWSVGQAAWRLGVTVREYRELEVGGLASLSRLCQRTRRGLRTEMRRNEWR